jgi:predicted ATPase
LITLVDRAGETVTKRELFSCVWPHLNVEESSLRVHISGLRKALSDGKDGVHYITNVPGRGYCFVAPVSCRNATPEPSPATATKRATPVQALPGRIKGLVGREGVVQALASELSAHRFLTIIGPPGVGKTVVAIAVADEWTARCTGEVCYVDLANDDRVGTVCDAIAERLGMKPAGTHNVAGLVSFLHDRSPLVVLDNCEACVDQVAALTEEWLARSSRVTLLVSSREALRARGERVRQLLALDFPPSAESAETLIENYPAVQLFLERVSMDGVFLDPSGNDSRAIARICRVLDGLPLAIEHAASCVRLYGLVETAQLAEGRNVLDLKGRRTAPSRHQTLRAMLDYSYGLLSEIEQTVFRRLAVLEEEFTVDAALAITSELASDAIRGCHAIGNLVSKSLLTRTTDLDGRSGYRFLRITHAYALDKLLQSGEAEAMYRRCASYVSKQAHGPDGTRAEAPLLLGSFPELPRIEARELSDGPLSPN